MTKPRAHVLFPLLGAFTVFLAVGCVSSKEYEKLVAENAKLEEQAKNARSEMIAAAGREVDVRREMEALHGEKVALEATLSSKQMQNITGLEDRLRDCKSSVTETKKACDRLIAETEKSGYYKGAAEFNASLQVAGVPRSDGWWVFASHYYEFQVQLRGEPLFNFVIETEQEQPPMQQSLAMVSELTKIMTFKKK